MINNRIRGRVEAASVDINWFSSQSITDFKLYDSKKTEILKIDSVTSSASLFTLIFSKMNIGTTEIKGLHADLISYDLKGSNLTDTLFPNKKKKENVSTPKKDEKRPTEYTLPFVGDFSIQKGYIKISNPQISPVEFTNIDVTLKADEILGPLYLFLNTGTKQATLSGNVKIIGEISGFDSKGKIYIDRRDDHHLHLSNTSLIKLNTHATNLPVAGLDYLLTLNYPKLRGTILAALGDMLNTTLKIQAEGNIASLNIYAESEYLKTDFKGEASNGEFLLHSPSTAFLTITPNLVNRLAQITQPDNQITIDQNVTASFIVNRFALPYTKEQIDLERLSTNIQFSIENLSFKKVKNLGNFNVKKFNAVIDSFEMGKNLTIHLQSVADQSNQPFSLNIDGQISHLCSTGACSLDQMDMNLLAEINHFPIPILDNFFASSSSFSTLVGPIANARLNATGSKKNTAVFINFSSDFLNIESLPLIFSNFSIVDLKNPMQFSYRLQPQAFSQLSDQMVLRLEHDTILQASIERLHLLLPKKGEKFDKNTIALTMDLETDLLAFSPVKQGLALTFIEPRVYLKAPSLATTRIRLQSQLSFSESKPLITPIIGNRSEIDLAIQELNLSDSTAFFIPVKIEYTSQLLQFSTTGNLINTSIFEMTEPLDARYTLMPEMIRFFDYPFPLKQNSSLKISLKPMKIPLKDFDLSAIKLDGKILSSSLIIGDASKQSVLDNIILNFDRKPNKNTFHFDLNARSHQMGETQNSGKIDVEGDITNLFSDQKLNVKQANFDIAFNLNQFPSSIMGLLTSIDLNWPTLLGPHLNLNLNATLNQDEVFRGEISIKAKSPLLNLSGLFAIADYLILKQPLSLNYYLTVDAFDILYHLLDEKTLYPKHILAFKNPILQDPSTVKVNMQSLKWPNPFNKKENTFDPAHSAIQADLLMDTLNIRDRMTKREVILNQFSINLNTPNFAESLKCDLKSLLKPDNPTAPTGELLIHADMQHLFNAKGKLNSHAITGLLNAKIQNFESLWLNRFLSFTMDDLPNLAAILGPNCNMKAQAQFKNGNGPINFELDTTNLKGSIDLRLNKDNLTLLDDATLILNISPAFSREILREVNPLLITAVSSQNPITINIYQEGFLIPINPFKLKTVRVKQLRIDLGKLTLQNGGVLGGLVNFLKLRNLSPLQEMEAWSTPLNVQIQDGIANYDRMDLLIAKNIHCATWGNTDLLNKQTNMTLAISPPPLYQSFGIKNLPSDYMLQIPMKGKSSDVRIDWGSATAQIAAIIAKETRGKKEAILGGVFDVIFRRGKPIPPPKKQFPWEAEGSGYQQSSYPQNTKEQKPVQQENETTPLQNSVDDLFHQIFQKRKKK